MPKKTKKQKIIASYRRKLQEVQAVRQKSHTGTKLTNTSATITSTPSSNSPDEKLLPMSPFVLKDMRNTLIVGICLIALEFLIFFVKVKV